MQIQLLWFEDCPNNETARELLDKILSEKGIEANIESVEVPNLKVGEKVRFPGSPTIRIDGVDVDPTYEDSGDYTPRCRVYLTSKGFKGVPERDWVERAIEAAA